MNSKDYVAPEYEEMVRGLNLTPEQTQELKRLYRHATFPSRPWSFIFAGTGMADVLLMLVAVHHLMLNKDPRLVKGWAVFMLIQLVLCLGVGAWSLRAEKQLKRQINELKAPKTR
ncbi:DUF2157 domain-containing protein [bacterium]|nr:DUF2157 domain-containing protein [bacterium]